MSFMAKGDTFFCFFFVTNKMANTYKRGNFISRVGWME